MDDLVIQQINNPLFVYAFLISAGHWLPLKGGANFPLTIMKPEKRKQKGLFICRTEKSFVYINHEGSKYMDFFARQFLFALLDSYWTVGELLDFVLELHCGLLEMV